MNSSETLPRLADRKSSVVCNTVDGGAASPKFLGRMSWQKGLLETTGDKSHGDTLFSLASPTKCKAMPLSGSASAPTIGTPSERPVDRRGSQLVSKTGSNQANGGPRTTILSYEESMDDVERMLREHMQQLQRQKASGGGKNKVISTLKQSAARRDPAKCEFEFAPLQDSAMLQATNDLRPSQFDEADEESDGDGGGGEDGEEGNEVNDPMSKYFGTTAKAAYYKTYQELHGKTHLFIEKPKKRAQTKTLKASAALATALDLRKASILKSIVSIKKPGAEEDKDSVGLTATHRKTLQPLVRSGSTSGSDAATASVLAASSSAVSSPSLHSPRVLFLSGCIAKSHPAISLVLRKHDSNVFDFRHQSLGDEFMIQFAACLPDLPHVESINASDNRLSDRALNHLLLALENKPNLTKLDISENEIGRESARSLRKYIASSLCTLKTLVLNDADIDDHECTLFMIAFEQNKSVERLLMASNRIGQTRKTAALGASTASPPAKKTNDKEPAAAPLPTGGESIGAMLNVNLTIQQLDLSWNMLRHGSTAPIANALHLNYNLCELNLSYNGCSDGGAMQLGHALRTNATLQKLNLAYNSIGPKGGLVLGSGLIVNKGLKELVLDGNPIGLDSARELMHASCSRIHTAAVCTLSMFECNLTSSKRARPGESAAGGNGAVVEANLNVYNPSDPAGKYNLDLSDPYEHMIAHELLRLSTFKRGHRFAKLEHTTATQPRVVTKIELHRDTNRKSSVVSTTMPEAVPTAQTQSSLSLLFAKIDKDRSGFVDHTELGEAMRSYGIRISDDLLERILAEYDYDKSGALGIDEFEDFFLRCGFAMVDADHSGALNQLEIEKVLKLMGFEDITEREIKRMMGQYDLNGSGEIDEHEFIEFMKAEVLQRAMLAKEAPAGEEMSCAAARSLEETYERTALRDPSGVIWKIPTSGFLAVDFQYDVVDDDGIESGGHRGPHQDLTTKELANNAITQLLGNTQNVSKNGAEQTDFLRAVLDTAGLFFTANQAEEVMKKQGALKSWSRKLHAFERLLPQMINRFEASALVNRLVDPARQWQQRRELRRKMPKLYSVFVGCPTNRYRFDLQNADERTVLKQLATFAHQEKLFSKNRSGRHDTSQNGDWENFRNAKVNGQVWLLTSTFILNSLLGPSNLAMIAKAEGAPGNAVESFLAKRIVEFDYVSTTRPPRGTTSLTPRRFDQLFEVWMNSDEVLKDSGPPPNDDAEGKSNARLRWEILRNHVFSSRKQQQGRGAKPRRLSMIEMKTSLDGICKKLELLEMLVCERWVSCEQAASLIAELPDAIFARARAATILFSRIVDLENFITIVDNLSREDQAECVKRLGWLNIFDPAQPDRQYPPLDLAVHDERELVQLLSKLALTEGHHCWKRASYRISSSDGSSHGQILPLPGWGNPEATGDESLKHHGIVRLRYESPSVEDSESTWDTTLRLELRSHTLCGTRLFLQ